MYFSLIILELLHLLLAKSRKTVSLKEEARCGELTLAGCQVPTKAALSLPFPSWIVKRKYNERIMGQDQGDHSPITITDLTWGKLF